MAPTVCMSELPMLRSTVSPYSHRRQRVHNGGIVRQHRLELRRLGMSVAPSGEPLTPPDSPLWEPARPNDFCAPDVSSTSANISAKVPTDAGEQWKVFFARRKGLLDIIIRTMALVRRNNILQEKVNALRAETRSFIRSVLNNPENVQRLEHSGCKDATVSSSTEEAVPRTSLPPTPDSACSSSSDVTSTCCRSDWETEESSCDES